MKKILIVIFLTISTIYCQITIDIDSIHISQFKFGNKTVNEELMVELFWTITNNSKDTINHFSVPWYLDPNMIVEDTANLDSIAKKIGGIGNSVVYCYCDDDSIPIKNTLSLYLHGPVYNDKLIKLLPYKKMNGRLITYFNKKIVNYKKVEFTIHYNSKFEHNSETKIYRTEIISGKFKMN